MARAGQMTVRKTRGRSPLRPRVWLPKLNSVTQHFMNTSAPHGLVLWLEVPSLLPQRLRLDLGCQELLPSPYSPPSKIPRSLGLMGGSSTLSLITHSGSPQTPSEGFGPEWMASTCDQHSCCDQGTRSLIRDRG